MKQFEYKPGNRFLGFIEAETPRAFLFVDWFWKEPQWMPKSQVEVHYGEYEVKMIASDWICKQNNMEEWHRER